MRPLVFLDVDGVVNDLEGIGPNPRMFMSHGYVLRVPEDIIDPIQRLVACCDVMWLTTWRERANNEIRVALGIPELPVISDGTDNRYVEWKWAACLPFARAGLAEHRDVFWIEDFYGRFAHHVAPEVFKADRFHFIDTWGCLRPDHLTPVFEATA